jgi:hypothetical protein
VSESRLARSFQRLFVRFALDKEDIESLADRVLHDESSRD